ncbi:diguanylate cyclase [Synechocystis sp. LKSZ1]
MLIEIIVKVLEQKDKTTIILLGFFSLFIIGIVDFYTGYQYAFSVFYVLPIALITLVSNQNLGLLASLLSACIFTYAEIASGRFYDNVLTPYWNILIRFSLFAIVSILLTAIKRLIKTERILARTDHLTAAVNARSFQEIMTLELYRLQRYHHPLTLVYFDLDNFKIVNDQLGHSHGDQALQSVVNCIKKYIRKTDTIARMGGDEFVLLLPETNREQAQQLVTDIRPFLASEMRKHNWPITFSMGVLTCTTVPGSIDELVTIADNLMYKAKLQGKNTVEYATYPG